MKVLLVIVTGGAVLMLILLLGAPAHAKEQKAKGVDVVPETAVTVLKKVNAFFTGDLTWTMPAGKDKYRNDYTINPIGNRIPRSTLGKYDDGVR
jgi:hypothetical protein